MPILGRVALLLVVFSVILAYKRVLGMECASCIKILSRSDDFGCGFFMFGRFSPFINLLGFYLGVVLGLKVLQVGGYKCLMGFLCDFRGKASDLRNGFCSKCGFGEVYVKSLENLQSPNATDGKYEDIFGEGFDDGADNDDEEDGCYNDDEEFDAQALRKLVKIERRKTRKAREEIEKERMASASAAEEAMAMILRLQNERSCVEIQANQYRRMAEQKQQYDEAVIQSLQWIVKKHESERSLLEEQLRLCKQDAALH